MQSTNAYLGNSPVVHLCFSFLTTSTRFSFSRCGFFCSCCRTLKRSKAYSRFQVCRTCHYLAIGSAWCHFPLLVGGGGRRGCRTHHYWGYAHFKSINVMCNTRGWRPHIYYHLFISLFVVKICSNSSIHETQQER